MVLLVKCCEKMTFSKKKIKNNINTILITLDTKEIFESGKKNAISTLLTRRTVGFIRSVIR